MLTFLVLAATLPGFDAIIDDPDLKGSLISARICDLEGKEIFARNPSQRVMPASNQKLISCAFALYELGVDYIPKTHLWKEPGKIYVQSAGDPGLTYDQLVEARKKLKLSGRDSVYLKQAYRGGIPESWEVDDLPNRYAAQVAAFSFDQAAFELWAEKGRAFLVPGNFGVKIRFDSKLADGATRYDPIRKVAYVGAKLPQKRTRLDTLALPDPDQSAASVLGNRLIYTDRVPDRKPDFTIEGKPMAENLKSCLVRSDNNMAENFFLMAASKEGPLGKNPYLLARQRATQFMTNVVGASKDDLHILDGSGMSRHNLVTAQAISQLLVWANRQSTAPLWKSALVSPQNGTLKNRLADVEFRGKTGTLDMVVSLSGYVRTKSGREMVMSLLLNHFTCSSAKARDIADKFAKSLSESSDGTADALSYKHEVRRSFTCNLSLGRNWANRFDRNRSPARPRKNRRTQSGDATVNRTKRMALRLR